MESSNPRAAQARTPTADSLTAAGLALLRAVFRSHRPWGRPLLRRWPAPRHCCSAAAPGRRWPPPGRARRCYRRTTRLRTIRELRAQDGPQNGKALQVMGSASLAAQLIEHDLVDEYRLMIEPILLGGGKRLFPCDGQARGLELVSAMTTATGVVMCTYRLSLTGQRARRSETTLWPATQPICSGAGHRAL